MTELRYLPDADDVTEFEATVTEATEAYVVLDGTYFYPEGGGQPADHGTLAWDGGRATVVDATKNHGDVRHFVENLEGNIPEAGTTVEGHVDEERRGKLRRMHTAQHVLSRVVLEAFDAATAGNQIHAERSRIDFEPAEFDDEDLALIEVEPAEFDDEDLALIEAETNRIIEEDLAVTKGNRPRAEVAENVPDGRTQLDLIPEHVDPLRVVAIEDFDLCPCGGTHVDSVGEIGRVEIVDRTSEGADVDRIEFELLEGRAT